jgi:hypothetical protein
MLRGGRNIGSQLVEEVRMIRLAIREGILEERRKVLSQLLGWLNWRLWRSLGYRISSLVER